MYIIKNALKSISRSMGRNILIGIIALVIAVSACIALSIKEAAVKAREDTLSLMNITAQITFDRKQAMEGMEKPEEGGFDRESMKEMIQQTDSLTLEEYETYSKAESVKGTYYSLSASMDTTGDLEPVDSSGSFSAESNDTSTDSGMPDMPNGMGGGREFKGMMGTQGDFTVVGYSSDEAMSEFVSGGYTIEEGAVFEEGCEDNHCIISDELATYNNLSLGSEITLANPNNTDETFTFLVVGIYSGTDTEQAGMMGGFSTATDPANKIMTSFAALNAICETSSESAEEVTDENTGLTTSTAVASTLTYTYIFADIEDYEAFADEAAALGLDEKYTISSSDVTSFEQSLTPLENLSTTAGYFLIVVFAIGAIILIVLNIFNIRERKYEIGVLTAIGMKKSRVALQFVTELFIITLAAIIIGAGVGAATSVPVTNALLSNQISANVESNQTMQQGFGRDTLAGGGGMTGMPQGERPDNMPQFDDSSFAGAFMNNTADYLAEVSYSTNLTVIGQLILVGIGLTLISSLAAVMFIMRYEPLKILTSRD